MTALEFAQAAPAPLSAAELAAMENELAALLARFSPNCLMHPVRAEIEASSLLAPARHDRRAAEGLLVAWRLRSLQRTLP